MGPARYGQAMTRGTLSSGVKPEIAQSKTPNCRHFLTMAACSQTAMAVQTSVFDGVSRGVKEEFAVRNLPVLTLEISKHY